MTLLIALVILYFVVGFSLYIISLYPERARDLNIPLTLIIFFVFICLWPAFMIIDFKDPKSL